MNFFSEKELSRIYSFLTNLNFITQANGVILDSESPIVLALDGKPLKFSVVYDDETSEYDLVVQA